MVDFREGKWRRRQDLRWQFYDNGLQFDVQIQTIITRVSIIALKTFQRCSRNCAPLFLAYQIRISILEVQLGEISVLVYTSFGRLCRYYSVLIYIRVFWFHFELALSLNNIKIGIRPRIEFFKNVLPNLKDRQY